MTENICYCLYIDKEQTELLAMAYSKEQLLEETQYYSKGYWFEYDLINNKFLENERILKKQPKFPENPERRPTLGISEEKEGTRWIKSGDLR